MNRPKKPEKCGHCGESNTLHFEDGKWRCFCGWVYEPREERFKRFCTNVSEIFGDIKKLKYRGAQKKWGFQPEEEKRLREAYPDLAKSCGLIPSIRIERGTDNLPILPSFTASQFIGLSSEVQVVYLRICEKMWGKEIDKVLSGADEHSKV